MEFCKKSAQAVGARGGSEEPGGGRLASTLRTRLSILNFLSESKRGHDPFRDGTRAPAASICMKWNPIE